MWVAVFMPEEWSHRPRYSSGLYRPIGEQDKAHAPCPSSGAETLFGPGHCALPLDEHDEVWQVNKAESVNSIELDSSHVESG